MSHEWTLEQPKDGDRILACEHQGSEHYHFFRIADPGEQDCLVTRSDGEKFRSAWIMICQACYTEHLKSGVDVNQFVKRDVYWIGDEPAIYKEPIQ